MARFHISEDGLARKCHAKDVCPLGSEVPHTEVRNQEEANRWAEKINEEAYGDSFGTSISEAGMKARLQDVRNLRDKSAEAQGKISSYRRSIESEDAAIARVGEKIKELEAEIASIDDHYLETGVMNREAVRIAMNRISYLRENDLDYAAKNKVSYINLIRKNQKISEEASLKAARLIQEYDLDLELNEEERNAADRIEAKERAKANSPLRKFKALFTR